MTPAPHDVQATFCATLVDQWIRLGLRHVVVAPGSRSTPMALALTARSEVAVDVFHDERSASFAALGIALATRVPAVLLCTSGTAAAHFHAAIIEAHQSGVPMVVVTADRPPELHGVGAPQTIEQANLYGGAVRWFHDPGVPVDAQRSTWRSVATRAWALAAADTSGPVHLNLPFREPLVGAVLDVPEPDPTELLSPPLLDVDDLLPLLDVEHGVILAGNGVDIPSEVQALATATNWPVLADPMSGCQTIEAAIVRFDAMLRNERFAETHRPQVVLQLGMPPASKVLAQWLASADSEHVAVSPAGLISDPNLVGARQVHAPIGALCAHLASKSTGRDTGWADEWVRADHVARSAIDAMLDAETSLSEPGVARAVTAAVPSPGHLVVASSMPVRDVEWFGAPRDSITIHANRGANGIDGVIATAIGVAIGSGQPTAVLLGDIAFCHDVSSLTAVRRRDLDLTIVVTDNDGGAIFSFLPQSASLPVATFEQLFGTPHGTDVVAVADAFGLRAKNVTTAAEVAAAFGQPGVSVVRIASDRSDNIRVHAALNAAVVAALG